MILNDLGIEVSPLEKFQSKIYFTKIQRDEVMNQTLHSTYKDQHQHQILCDISKRFLSLLLQRLVAMRLQEA